MSAAALLKIIAGHEVEGYFEIRYNRNGRPGMLQDFVPVQFPETVISRCELLAPHGDVFVGAAPRTHKAGGKAAIRRAWCLWCDLDTPDALERLTEYSYRPTLVVRSGSGANVHAWFALSHPLPSEWIVRANKKLAHHLGADMKATDVARIMRPPGTRNHKHSPAVLVETAEVDLSRVYRASDLVAGLPDPVPPKPPVAVRVRERHDALETVPVESYYTALTGWEPSTGHVTCPFWEHRSNPAMMLYPDTDTFHCFACDRGGDVYEFGAALWDMDRRREFVALRKRLGQELGVDV